MATGKAAVLDRPMGTFHIEEFRVPDPAPGTVLLRQELAGCCATDAHTYLGQWPADFPVILGHENVGIVEAIGSGGALDFLGREVRVGTGSSPARAPVAPVMSAVWRISPDAVAICAYGMASPGRKTLRSAAATASISISARPDDLYAQD